MAVEPGHNSIASVGHLVGKVRLKNFLSTRILIAHTCESAEDSLNPLLSNFLIFVLQFFSFSL